MCGGCRVKVGDGVKFACVDGPDFDGHQVDFDDLMARLVRFRRSEQQALAHWQQDCRIRGDDAVAALRAQVLPGAGAAAAPAVD
jgi:hypothetical protein